jgi:hypothetical protein
VGIWYLLKAISFPFRWLFSRFFNDAPHGKADKRGYPIFSDMDGARPIRRGTEKADSLRYEIKRKEREIQSYIDELQKSLDELASKIKLCEAEGKSAELEILRNEYTRKEKDYKEIEIYLKTLLREEQYERRSQVSYMYPSSPSWESHSPAKHREILNDLVSAPRSMPERLEFDAGSGRSSIRKTQPVFNITEQSKEVFSRSAELKKLHEDLVADVGFAMDNMITFADLAWANMKRSHCIYKETFRERTLLSDKYFDLIKSRRLPKPDLESVMALCVGLNLGVIHGEPLLKIAGYDLASSSEPLYRVYRVLICTYHKHTIYECNEVLLALGLPPLKARAYYDMLGKKQQFR